MSKTFKDKPDQYNPKKRKPKEGKRFESTKGRKNSNLKDLVRKGYNLDDIFV